MQERIRVAAIIVQNEKILLVKGSDKYLEFWTPGGKLESNESELDCLKRELNEELGVNLVSTIFFKEYLSKSPYIENMLTRSKVYLTEISGELKPNQEIKSFVWMSKNDFKENKFPLIDVMKNNIIPDLIHLNKF